MNASNAADRSYYMRKEQQISPEEQAHAACMVNQLHKEGGLTLTRIAEEMLYTDSSVLSHLRSGKRSISRDRYEILFALYEKTFNPAPKKTPLRAVPRTEEPAMQEAALVVTEAAPSRQRTTLEDLETARNTLDSLCRMLTQTATRAVPLIQPGLERIVSRLQAIRRDLEV